MESTLETDEPKKDQEDPKDSKEVTEESPIDEDITEVVGELKNSPEKDDAKEDTGSMEDSMAVAKENGERIANEPEEVEEGIIIEKESIDDKIEPTGEKRKEPVKGNEGPVAKKRKPNKTWVMQVDDDNYADFDDLLDDLSGGKRTNKSQPKSEERLDPSKLEALGPEFGQECQFVLNQTNNSGKLSMGFRNPNLKSPMGVATFEHNGDEYVLIANTYQPNRQGIEGAIDLLKVSQNGSSVELILTLPKDSQGVTSVDQASSVHALKDGSLVSLDRAGFHIFPQTNFEFTKRNSYKMLMPPKGDPKYSTRGKAGPCFGLFASRKGEIGTYANDSRKGHVIFWWNPETKTSRECMMDFGKFGCSPYEVRVRFAKHYGNTIALSDMNPKQSSLWLCDNDGGIRKRINLSRLDIKMAAGCCFDNDGKILLADSRGGRILMFSPEGEYKGDVRLSPPLDKHRVTDISLTNSGILVVITLTQHLMLYKLNGNEMPPEYATLHSENENDIFSETIEIQPKRVADSKADFENAMNEWGSSGGNSPKEEFTWTRKPSSPDAWKKPSAPEEDAWPAPPSPTDSWEDRSQSRGRGRGRGGHRGRGRGGYGGQRDRENSADRSREGSVDRQSNGSWGKSRSSSPEKQPSNTGWGAPIKSEGNKSPSSSGGGWGGAPASSKASPTPCGGGWDTPSSPPASSGGGWGGASATSKDSKPVCGGGWDTPTSPPPSGGGWGGHPSSPARASSGGGWGTRSPVVKDSPTSGGWGSQSSQHQSIGGGFGSQQSSLTTPAEYKLNQANKSFGGVPERSSSGCGSSSSASQKGGWGSTSGAPTFGSGYEASKSSGGWGASSEVPSSSGGGWGASSDVPSSSGGGWGPSSDISSSSGGWGASSDVPSSSGGGWGASSDVPKSSGGGWGASSDVPSSGGGWGSSRKLPEPVPSSGGGWGGNSQLPDPSSGGGWGAASMPSSTGGWGSTQEKPVSSGGWGAATPKAEPTSDGFAKGENVEPSAGGWGASTPLSLNGGLGVPDAGSTGPGANPTTAEAPRKELLPKKPTIVNTRPLVREVDPSRDPRLATKKRISLDAYKKAHVSISHDEPKEDTRDVFEPLPDLEVVEPTPPSSPTSPVFEPTDGIKIVKPSAAESEALRIEVLQELEDL